MALSGQKLRYTKWLNLRQLLEPSGREMGCGSEDFGLKMTQLRHQWLRVCAAHIAVLPHFVCRSFLF
jgi:hypothetical protein